MFQISQEETVQVTVKSSGVPAPHRQSEVQAVCCCSHQQGILLSFLNEDIWELDLGVSGEGEPVFASDLFLLQKH